MKKAGRPKVKASVRRKSVTFILYPKTTTILKELKNNFGRIIDRMASDECYFAILQAVDKKISEETK